jgi:glycosyltransferase involved in cell wall biosynthesis
VVVSGFDENPDYQTHRQLHNDCKFHKELKSRESEHMKILFVAMSGSIHIARWINQIADQGWDIHLFPSIDYGGAHQDLKNVTVYHSIYSVKKNRNQQINYYGYPVFSNSFAWLLRSIKSIISPDYRSFHLKKIITELQPDIIHSLEFQSAGYLTFIVKKLFRNKFPIWIATNWGSDIYYFRQFPEHREKITQILQQCDYYSCECERDIRLAQEMGLRGKVLPLFPNTGGFDLDSAAQFRQPGLTSDRNIILLKGYHGWAGRALSGLQALALCGDILKQYKIVIYSADPAVKKYAGEIRESGGLAIECIPQSSHKKMLWYFGHARLYIGLSITDAISTSLLEAIVMGAFPIQSDTSCADEWIVHGKNGFIVAPEDPVVVAEAIKKALQDNDLVNTAASMNDQIAQSRLDNSIIKFQVIEMYKKIVTSR